MRASGFKNTFTSAEISPNAWERTELEHHQKGCAEALNMLALPTGPLVSRGGFLDRGAVKFEDRLTRGVAFIRSPDDALFLELGRGYMRVFDSGGNFLTETHSPYDDDEVFKLRWEQVGDVIYFFHSEGIRAPKVLKRIVSPGVTPESWEWLTPGFVEGPFLKENESPTTLTFAADEGANIAITASAPVFHSGHAGAVWRIRQNDGNTGLRTWAPATAYNEGDQVLSNGRIYECQQPGGGTSGNTPPVHEVGNARDGVLDWQFLHDGAGVVRIINVIGDTEARCDILTRIPTTAPTRYWSEGAFSDYRGWPTAWPAVREERLWIGSAPTDDDAVYASRTDGFTPNELDYKPGLGTGRVVDDDAIDRSVGGGRGALLALVNADSLMAFTTAGEYVILGAGTDEPLSPTSFVARPVGEFGSDDVKPVRAMSAVLHVAAGGSMLREIVVDRLQNVQSRDLSIVADHISSRGLIYMEWSRPDNVLWTVVADSREDDGGLAAFSYHAEQGVMGWTRQRLPSGWIINSICRLPAPAGREHLWAIVSREKGGVIQRRIWRMAARRDQCWMDGAEFRQGPPTTAVAGLDHYEGESVCVLADGVLVGDLVVSGGQVTLTTAASDVWVGQRMPRRFTSLPLDLQGPDGTLHRELRPLRGTVVLGCVTAEVGVQPDDAVPGEAVAPLAKISTRRPQDLVPVLRRQREDVVLGGGADLDNRVVCQCVDPFDLVIYGMRLVADVNER
jgi:hypothetical protein